MQNFNEIWAIEEDLWLKGVETFKSYLAEDCLMAFPPPTGLLTREEIIETLKQAPRWNSLLMSQKKMAQVREDLCVIAYEAAARRGDALYRALCSSSYVRTAEGWCIFQHQQTPLG